MAHLLLASASPRRLALLEALGHHVRVCPVAVDERELDGETPDDYQARIVDDKLRAAVSGGGGGLAMTPSPMAKRLSDPEVVTPAGARAGEVQDRDVEAVVVADTMVVLDDHILHKPEDVADHRRMLSALSARDHRVTTRFALGRFTLGRFDGAVHVESVSTRVWFRALGTDELATYLATDEGHDKAGGYAIQGRGAGFVVRIDGSYGAVVGLPSAQFEVGLRRLLSR